jgi:hypothetical protein
VYFIEGYYLYTKDGSSGRGVQISRKRVIVASSSGIQICIGGLLKAHAFMVAIGEGSVIVM